MIGLNMSSVPLCDHTILKVLHVVDSLNPGGMENGVVNMACRLHSKGVGTHVACLRERGAFAERLPDPHEVTVLGKRDGFSWGSVAALRALIRRLRPHVIHTHNLGPLIYASLATLGGLTIPLLHGEHGQIQTQDLTPRRLATRRLLYRSCHTVHTVSSSLLESLRAKGLAAGRMTAITNGVDCDHFLPSQDVIKSKERIGIKEGRGTTIGIVGRFVALKRHLMLFRAIEPIMRDDSNVALVIIGDNGPERENILLAMEQHPFADRIRWLGMRSDMAACYQGMDLLVSPSEVEGLSNAVLEAMACGVPVLAHLACGNNEAVANEEGGYLRDLPDADSLTHALKTILADPGSLLEQGRRARARAVARFSIDSMAEGYHRLYKAVAGGG